MPMRTLRPGQRTVVMIGGPELAEPEIVFETDEILLEAPNWTAGGRLLLNGEGRLFSLDLPPVADCGEGAAPTAPAPAAEAAAGSPRGAEVRTGPRLREIPFDGLPPINNDHVLHPDGAHIYMSAADGQIHRGRLDGGPVEAVTTGEGGHFLHGISPDGALLAYVDVDTHWQGRLVVQDLATGERAHVPTGTGHVDGPEWTPDGRWLLCSSEAFTSAPGHAQITRVPAPGRIGDGAGARHAGAGMREPAADGPEHVLISGTVDWFPHPSPDGRWASYLTYPPGTLGHPEDREVVVKLVELPDWSRPVRAYAIPGGQGTINVNSWAPASDRFAFVSYPIG
ncbi:TolB family protein [Brachybacterium hainanense]|uniref:TolB family protein n=1 Tax=Brachybacterium hainanense TaxID=1541174 RepID=A0ABV6R7P0_9MICO